MKMQRLLLCVALLTPPIHARDAPTSLATDGGSGAVSASGAIAADPKAFSIGSLTTYSPQWKDGLKPADNRRRAILPALHFDGQQWREFSSTLGLSDAERLDAIDPASKGQPGSPLYMVKQDASLNFIAARAKLRPEMWARWQTIDARQAMEVQGAWQMWPSCQPQWVLTPKLSGTSDRQLNDVSRRRYVTSADIATPLFKRVSIKSEDPMRIAAIKKFAALGASELASAKDAVMPQNMSRVPQTASALERVPLRWWRAYCADDLVQGDRICQLVARRRFDGKTDPRHDVEPLQYEAWIIQRNNNPPNVYKASANWRPISDTWHGTPPDPETPIAIVPAGGKRWVWLAGQMLEGNSQCVQPIEPSSTFKGKRAGGVCAYWGC